MPYAVLSLVNIASGDGLLGLLPEGTINHTKENIFQWNFIDNSNIFIQESAFKSVYKMSAIILRLQCIPSGAQKPE